MRIHLSASRAAALLVVIVISLSGCGGSSGTTGGTPAATTTATTVPITQPTSSVPDVPTAVTTVGGTNKVTISWNAVSGSTSYTVYWSTVAGGAAVSGTGLVTLGTSYIQRGLLPATTYFYVVSANNSSGESVASGEHSAVTATLDGATPYTAHCAGCHGRLATSAVTNMSATEIKTALQSVASMGGLVVTDAEITAISAALMYNE